MTIYTDENRKSTLDLIENFGKPIGLSRKGEQIRTAAGGVRRIEDSTNKAAVRRYFGSTSGSPTVVTTSNGERVSVTYVLIGPVGDDIQEDDEFTIAGETYRVFAIDPVTVEYQRKGWCDRRGRV